MASSKTQRLRLVVTGATGKQGGALIQALLAHPNQPFDIYAMTRNKNSSSAQSLASKPNVKVIEGDFNGADAILKQVPNAWGIFSVTTPMGKGGAKTEEAQGKALTKAALDAGVKHIVYTSVDRGANSDTDPTNVPHFASKKNVEDDIKEKTKNTNVTWTILRPVAFMDNMTNDFLGRAFVSVWNLNGSNTKLQMIGTKDIGKVAAEAFLDADKEPYKNKSIQLAGDDISPNEADKIFREVTGHAMPETYSFIGRILKWLLNEELGKMFDWFKTDGYHSDVQALREQYPFLKDFRQWLEEESAWRKQ